MAIASRADHRRSIRRANLSRPNPSDSPARHMVCRRRSGCSIGFSVSVATTEESPWTMFEHCVAAGSSGATFTGRPLPPRTVPLTTRRLSIATLGMKHTTGAMSRRATFGRVPPPRVQTLCSDPEFCMSRLASGRGSCAGHRYAWNRWSRAARSLRRGRRDLRTDEACRYQRTFWPSPRSRYHRQTGRPVSWG